MGECVPTRCKFWWCPPPRQRWHQTECHLFLLGLKCTCSYGDWFHQLELNLILLKQLWRMWSTFLGGLVDLTMIFLILTQNDLLGFDNNHGLAKLPDHWDTKYSRHLRIAWMLLKTSKITQTLNLTKVIEWREMHINCGDTMINIVMPQLQLRVGLWQK